MARRIRLGGVEIELIARSGKAVANLKKLGAEVQRQTRIQKALRREYYRSRRQVLRSVKSMISLRGAVATLAGAGGLGLLVTRSVAAADAIGKSARAVGLSAEAYQEWLYVADRSGVGAEKFTSGLITLTRRVGKLRVETGTLFAFLNRFDKSLLGPIGSATSLEEVLDIVVRRAEKMGDVMNRATFLGAAFGDTLGPKLASLIDEGGQGVDRLRKRARDLGFVLGDDLVQSAETTQDALTDLSKVFETTLTRTVLDNSQQIEAAVKGLAESLPGYFATISAAIRTLAENLTLVTTLLGAAKGALTGLRFGPWGAAIGAGAGAAIGAGAAEVAAGRGPTRWEQAKAFGLAGLSGIGNSGRRRRRWEPDIRIVSTAPSPEIRSGENPVVTALQKQTTELKRGPMWGKIPSLRRPTDPPTEEILKRSLESSFKRGPMWGKTPSLRRPTDPPTEEILKRSLESSWSWVGPLPDLMTKITEDARALGPAAIIFRDTLLEGFQRGIASAQSLREIMLSIAANLASTLAGLGIHVAFGGPAKTFFNPVARQHGGPVTAGTAYLVGERGPEILIPRVSGQIEPNAGLGGRSLIGELHISVNSTDGPGVIAAIPRITEAVRAALRPDLIRDLHRISPLRR